MNTFNIESWGQKGAGQFGILLALTGIPITGKAVVSFKEPFTPQQPPQPITVAKLKRIGIMHLRPPPPSNPNQPDHWVNTWGIRGTQLAVMEVPFMLAQAALDFTPNTNKLFNGASHLLTNFYPTATSFKKLRLAPLRVYIDTKHTQIRAPADNTLSYSDNIKALISKRRYLAEQFPEEEHIMVITSNKRAQQPGGKPHTAATLLRVPTTGSGGANEATSVDPRTCIITATDDSLAWALSPTFAHFLVVDKAGKE